MRFESWRWFRAVESELEDVYFLNLTDQAKN